MEKRPRRDATLGVNYTGSPCRKKNRNTQIREINRVFYSLRGNWWQYEFIINIFLLLLCHCCIRRWRSETERHGQTRETRCREETRMVKNHKELLLLYLWLLDKNTPRSSYNNIIIPFFYIDVYVRLSRHLARLVFHQRKSD